MKRLVYIIINIWKFPYKSKNIKCTFLQKITFLFKNWLTIKLIYGILCAKGLQINYIKEVNMKSTGIVRRVDELGRVVIPIEIRNKFEIAEKDPIEIYV